MATRFEKIAELVRKHPAGKLSTLVHHINVTTLEESYRKLSRNKAAGVDGMNKEEYGMHLNENLIKLMKSMKKQAYKPQPVKRVYIPKDG